MKNKRYLEVCGVSFVIGDVMLRNDIKGKFDEVAVVILDIKYFLHNNCHLLPKKTTSKQAC